MNAQANEHDTATVTATEPPAAQTQPTAGSRLDVTGTQVCASTLASVSAAVVASFFGVAGTVGGAAVVSVIATAGSAVYSHGIRQTGAKLQDTQADRLTRPLRSWQRPGATREADNPDASGAPGPPASSASTHRTPRRDRSTSGWKAWLSQRRWGVVLGVAIVFVASLATVTLIELVGQQPLASITGNEPSGSTSIGSLFDDSASDTPGDTPTSTNPTESPTSSDAGSPAEEPGTATTAPTPSEDQPTATDPPPTDPVTPDDTTSD
jgi:hypothetical protein